MTRDEFIKKLMLLPNIEVEISDGHEGEVYVGDFSIETFSENGREVIDIGIGECLKKEATNDRI